jgi:hypothetical protein
MSLIWLHTHVNTCLNGEVLKMSLSPVLISNLCEVLANVIKWGKEIKVLRTGIRKENQQFW